ncbi:MAG: hypothetical protein KY475_08085 [Planctomycetes bacterium]|nr:hypothetical protein [Planctomycetota bacterium]
MLHQTPFTPPEDWHEPSETQAEGYRIVVQKPAAGFQHVVTPEEIRRRLARLPEHMLEPLEVVQLSRLTRKQRAYPCYGMQWGQAVYLYPMEADLIEHYTGPPTPAELIEARMYGGCWEQVSRKRWRLRWTQDAIKDFYLNNVLIHEIGHLLDDRNSSTRDRERYAEWFAIHHGYKPTRSDALVRRRRKQSRRHGR